MLRKGLVYMDILNTYWYLYVPKGNHCNPEDGVTVGCGWLLSKKEQTLYGVELFTHILESNIVATQFVQPAIQFQSMFLYHFIPVEFASSVQFLSVLCDGVICYCNIMVAQGLFCQQITA